MKIFNPGELTEVYYINMLLKYHYATDQELTTQEMKQEYSFMAGMTGRRIKWLEDLNDTVTGFSVGT